MNAIEALTEDLTAAEVQEVFQLYREEALREAAQADARLAHIGRLNRAGTRSLDGLGAVTSRFDAHHFYQALALQGANARDPDFRPWLLKREESDYARVRCGGTKVMVAGGSVTDGCSKRFSKTYA